mmetsp:Transcript_16345/g.41887  ORF Transcript_16345/g.41887 Transcript_16345/m.41887 type:complete len:368 (-) Transcript_16345:207-1310(-)
MRVLQAAHERHVVLQVVRVKHFHLLPVGVPEHARLGRHGRRFARVRRLQQRVRLVVRRHLAHGALAANDLPELGRLLALRDLHHVCRGVLVPLQPRHLRGCRVHEVRRALAARPNEHHAGCVQDERAARVQRRGRHFADLLGDKEVCIGHAVGHDHIKHGLFHWFVPTVVPLQQLAREPGVGVAGAAYALHVGVDDGERLVPLPHEVGNQQGGRPRHALVAMNEDLATIVNCLVDEIHHTVEHTLNVHTLAVCQVQRLVVKLGGVGVGAGSAGAVEDMRDVQLLEQLAVARHRLGPQVDVVRDLGRDRVKVVQLLLLGIQLADLEAFVVVEGLVCGSHVARVGPRHHGLGRAACLLINSKRHADGQG